MTSLRDEDLKTDCLRKLVVARAFRVTQSGSLLLVGLDVNGPADPCFACSNETGNCGCFHAEQKLVHRLFRVGCPKKYLLLVLPWSPCTTCANHIAACGFFWGVLYGKLTQHDPRGAERLSRVMPCSDDASFIFEHAPAI